jgi:hypothetical protein
MKNILKNYLKKVYSIQLLILLLIVFTGYKNVYAQWLPSGATPDSMIYRTGNVGIGTNNPSEKLEVKDGRISIVSYDSSEDLLKISNFDGLFTTPALRMGKVSTLGHSEGYACLSLSRYTDDSFDERIVIRAAGNSYINPYGDGKIGIGTINPTEKLSVNGKIRAKEIIVNTGWSDFVFEEDYNLRPLTEVEEFIKTNKHLPEIPTAKEVEENGVSLGNMQSKLLQKIEELTLYIIEEDKKIEEQYKVLESLERE